jgi:ATP-dependent DNA ligase
LSRASPKKPTRCLRGGLWVHEIKHDGFCIIARKNGARVLANLRTRSCIIDGEAVACDENGAAVFDRIRYRRHAPCAYTPSTLSNWMVTTCGVNRLMSARPRCGLSSFSMS